MSESQTAQEEWRDEVRERHWRDLEAWFRNLEHRLDRLIWLLEQKR